MLVFSNPGTLSKTAITTLGIHAKEHDNAIGQFGTGLKYSIAGVLRLGGSIKIYNGTEEYVFGLKKIVEREKEFEVVTLNGEQLGFTTHMGAHWEPWMYYRELESNCRDEKGITIRNNSGIRFFTPEEGIVNIVVNCKEIDKAYENRDTIFLASKPIFSNELIDIHPGRSRYIYYRGIRVYEHDKFSAFTYNIKQHIQLTEDRNIKEIYIAARRILAGLIGANEKIWEQAFKNKEGMEETFTIYSYDITDATLFEWIKAAVREDALGVISNIINAFMATERNQYDTLVKVAMNEYEKKKIADSAAFLRRHGFHVNVSNIYKTTSIKGQALACTYNNDTYISERAFMQSDDGLIAVLLEEQLNRSYADLSRGRQNYLTEALIKYMRMYDFMKGAR